MADGTQLNITENGRLAVTKQAAVGPGAERLRLEARILRRAAHPGVVELLVGELEGEDGITMGTAFVGGGTLAEHLGALDVARGAKLAATLAATLADLHERGVAHQRVTPDHVMVTEADQIRLCGFAEAILMNDVGPCDPDAAAIDVEAVAVLVREIADRSPGDAVSLRAVADRVLGTGPLARPSMRTLAQALASVAGGTDDVAPPVAQGQLLLPARSATSRHAPRLPRGRARSASLAVVAVAVASVTVVLAAKVTYPRPPSQSVAAPAPPPTSLDTSRTTTTVALLTSVPVQAPERAAVRVWPPDPESGTEVVEVASGVVSSSGRRWQVASANDLVSVGDWNCDGVATPAVVRHGTGQIWVYTHWAEGTQAVPVDAATVPDAVSAKAVDSEGCHHLEVIDTAGQKTRLDLRS